MKANSSEQRTRTATAVAVLVALVSAFVPAVVGATLVAPTPSTGGPYEIHEGDDLVLDGSSSAGATIHAWDLDDDGRYDDAYGANPTITWSTLVELGLGDDGSYPISLETTDGANAVTATTTLTIRNTPPRISVVGEATAATDAPYELRVSVDDPGHDTVTDWTVNWGDGSIDTLRGAPGWVSHRYALVGATRDITVALSDEDGTWTNAEVIVAGHDSPSRLPRLGLHTGEPIWDLGPRSASLQSAFATTIGPDGLLYVTDHGSHTVERFDPADNTYVDTFIPAARGTLDRPTGLAFGPDGHLYVASAGTGEITRHDGSDGRLVAVFVPSGVLGSPTALAFDTDGVVHVADADADTIERFDSRGRHLGTLATLEAGSTPAAITWGPGGDLFVALAGAGRVEHLETPTGETAGSYEIAGLETPTGVGFGPGGELWVADRWTDVLHAIDTATGEPHQRLTVANGSGPRGFAFVPDHQVTVVAAEPPSPEPVPRAPKEKPPSPAVAFEPNEGQFDPRVDYLARMGSDRVFLTRSGVTIERRTGNDGYAVELRWAGATATPTIAPDDATGGRTSYILGDDPAQWVTGVRSVRGVTYADMYPDIDVEYVASANGFRYDLVVRPGGNPDDIAVTFDGATDVTITAKGELDVAMDRGRKLRFSPPFAYQGPDDAPEAVDSAYVRNRDGSIGFSVGSYDATRPLVIDPTLQAATFLGGTGVDDAQAIAVDAAGNTYVTGSTDSATYPATTGPIGPTGGTNDVIVTKLAPDLATVVYTTYVGGKGDDVGFGIDIDGAGNAYIAGETVWAGADNDFPTTAGAHDEVFGNGTDGFVFKLNAAGTALAYSTYLGTTTSNDDARAVAVDGAGRAHVTGEMSSGFATTGGSFQPTYGGGMTDAYLAIVNPTGTALDYSTYLGGGTGGVRDAGYAIDVDASGRVYITGQTNNTDFPVSATPYQGAIGGGIDAFVSVIDPLGGGGSDLVYSTYLGGDGQDNGYGLQATPDGKVHVTGRTADGTTDFPTTGAAYDTTHNGNYDVFFATVDPALNGAPSLVYATFVGHSGEDGGYGIAVDALGRAHLTGLTKSASYPTSGNAHDPSKGGTQDAFVTVIDPAGGGAGDLAYSTFFGGSANDVARGVGLDAAGKARIGGATLSADVGATTGAYDETLGGTQDAFVASFGAIPPPGTVVVNSTADVVDLAPGDGACDTGNLVGPDPECTLRAAVQEVNASASLDTIDLPAATYTFTIGGSGDASVGDLNLDTDMTIVGADMDTTIVDGAVLDRVFDVPSATTVTISDLTIRNGKSVVNGGGIRTNGTVTLERVSLRNNEGSNGGGIRNDGTLTMLDVELVDNTATADGGGMFNNGTVIWTGGTASGNTGGNGGAVRNSGPAGLSLTLTNVTLSGNNVGAGNGAAVYTQRGVAAVNATIADNVGGNDVHTAGPGSVDLTNSIVANDVCGGGATIVASGGNIESPGNTCGLETANVTVGALNLAALADNGGPTQTRALVSPSVAIDPAPALTGAPPTDQRGEARDASPDVGAYELATAPAAMDAIWLTTRLDVPSPSGAPGLDSWLSGQVLSFADPNFALDPSPTNGTLTTMFDVEPHVVGGAAEIDAIHFMTSSLVVGSANAVTLEPGDLVFSMEAPETFTTEGFTAEDEDIVLFEPSLPGDYTNGTFSLLYDMGTFHIDDTRAVTIAEKATTVGDATVPAGTLFIGRENRRDIIRFDLTDVGVGTAGVEIEFADGPSMNFGSELRGLELIEETVDLAGVTIPAGRFLATIANDGDTVGSSGRSQTPANGEDVFALDISVTGASAVADAYALFDGSAVFLDTLAEDVVGLTLSTLATPLPAISGTVFEDVAGDVLADGVVGDANHPGTSTVDVHLYRDDDSDGIPEATDTFMATVQTDVNGLYTFPSLAAADYFVVVDSKTLDTVAGRNGPFTTGDIWAEQTYAPDFGHCSDGAGGTSVSPTAGPCYGGRTGAASDDLTTWHSGAEHLAEVALSTADVTGVDFGFSYNVVTTTAGGDTRDDDVATNRTVQGSIRQFLQNANAIAGPNAMRLVPSVATNGVNGADTWWRIDIADALPPITDGTTTIDGTAFDLLDGSTPLDSNTASLGTGTTVGVDAAFTTPLLDPELEIVDSAGVLHGLDVNAADATIRHASIHGFDTANVNVQERQGRFEFNVLGAGPAAFTDPGAGNRSLRNIDVDGFKAGFIEDNLIGFSEGNAVRVTGGANDWNVRRNEIREAGLLDAQAAAVFADNAGGIVKQELIEGNLIEDNHGPAIRFLDGNGNDVINNTIRGNGTGTLNPPALTAAVHIDSLNNTVDRNIINGNHGPGLMIGAGGSSTGNTITQNSMFANGTILDDLGGPATAQIGIDLLEAADDQSAGTAPYVTVNDDLDSDSGGNTVVNFPVLDAAGIVGTDLVVTGWAPAGAVVELFIADPDPSGFGEGKTWLITKTEGSGDDTDATTSGYGPGAINGLAQGAETTTERFRFTIPLTSLAAPISGGESVTSTGTDALGNTSEFSGNVTVGAPNDPPTFDQDLLNRIDPEAALISLSAAATDPNLDPLTYSATGLPLGLSINATTGLITGLVNHYAAAGSPYSVEITVDDDKLGRDTDTFTWTITNVAAVDPYVVADVGGSNGGDDLLSAVNALDMDPATNQVDIGLGTGTSTLLGMEIEPVSGAVFAADGGVLGTLDVDSGAFSAVGPFGSGTGDIGLVSYTDVRGVMFHPLSGQLYAVHRVAGDKDVLIEVDPITGAAIADAFNGGRDYAQFKGAAPPDVTAIATDPTDFASYGVFTDGVNHELRSINRKNGASNKIGDLTVAIEGLAFDPTGQLWGTDAGTLYEIDKTTGATSNPRTLDNDSDYRALAIAVPPAFPPSIEGIVFEDISGNALGATELVQDPLNPGRPGVSVRLYADDGTVVGEPDASDTLQATKTTGPTGHYYFTSLPAGVYWMTVDSSTISPAAGGTGVPEQTYGPAEAVTWAGTYNYALAAGPLYGGMRPAVADDASLLPTAEHVVRVDLSPGEEIAAADVGFSFNVVTNLTGGGLSNPQGSLRRFIANANDGVGPNSMRFVPVVSTNATDGAGNDWWSLAVSLLLPALTDAGTTIDGTAYDATDGTTVLDPNAGSRGTNAAGGTTVGVDAVPLPQVAAPELEIVSSGVTAAGLEVRADDTTVRGLAIYGFGDTGVALTDGDIEVPTGFSVGGLTVEDNIIGAGAGAFADPGAGNRSGGSGVALNGVTGAPTTVRDNLIGFVDELGVGIQGSDTIVVTGNEIRGVGNGGNIYIDALSAEESSSGVQFIANLVDGAPGNGVSMWRTGGSHLVRNNTIANVGTGGAQTAAVAVFGTGSTVDKNVLSSNAGPAVAVVGENPVGGAYTWTAASSNRISQNTFGGNAGLALDLTESSDAEPPHEQGDGVTLTAGTLATTGNNGLDAPAISTATTTDVTGTTCANCDVEVYRSVAGAGDTWMSVDYGEGVEYLGTATADGLGDWTLGGITALVNGDHVSAITIDASNNTSEFGANVGTSTSDTISGTVFEDVVGDVLADGAVGDANHPGVAGVDVHLYRDVDSDGLPEGTDPYVATVQTDVNGLYTFSGLAAADYFVVVDSKTVDASAGRNLPFTTGDIWAEQTYGPDFRHCSDGAGGTSVSPTAGPCYGGRTGTASDDLTTWHTGAEHLAEVALSTANVTGVDFGFSFNVVTTTAGGDTRDDDVAANRTVQGSLRQYIRNANAIVGANAMRLVPSVATNAIDGGDTWWRIDVANALLPVSDDFTTIDGTSFDLTDGATVLDTNANGPELELDGSTAVAADGIDLDAAGNVVRDITIGGFGDPGRAGVSIDAAAADTNTVAGAFIGTNGVGTAPNANFYGIRIAAGATSAVVGGSVLADRNVISGNTEDAISITGLGTDLTSVRGNYIGTDAAGSAPLANGDGIQISGDPLSTVIGGSAADRNIISGNSGQGIHVAGDSTVVWGNRIGTNAAGTAAIANQRGVWIDGAAGVQLGAADPTLRNLISGNTLVGVLISNGADDNTVAGNRIGTNAPGSGSIPNTGPGLRLDLTATNNTIGGTAADAGNLIANNAGDGVEIGHNASLGNAVLGNSLVANGGLGVDLLPDGPTVNDPGDGDPGPNNLLNRPMLGNAVASAGRVRVGYTLDVPAGTYRIELYTNPSGADGSGYGEAEVLVASKTVNHAGGGREAGVVWFAGGAGDVITASVTEDLGGGDHGNTSELSNAVTAVNRAARILADKSVRRSDAGAAGGLNPAATVAGAAGLAVDLDGYDDRLVGPTLDVTGAALTVAAWIKPQTLSGFPRIVSKRTAAGAAIYELFIDAGTGEAVATVRVGGAPVIVRGGTVGVGAWHHLSVTWDGVDVVLYVDGVEVDRLAAAGTLSREPSTRAVIGSNQSSRNSFDGLVDDVRIHHAAATEETMAAHHANVTNASFVTVGAEQTSTPGAWTTSAAQTRSGGFSMLAPETSGPDAAAWAVATGIDESGVVFESWWWVSTDTGIDLSSGSRAGASPTDEYEAALVSPLGWELRQRVGASEAVDAAAAGTPASGAWVKVELWTDQLGDSRLFIDGLEVTSWTSQGGALASGSMAVRAGLLPIGETWYVDDARGRKLITPEPVATLGSLDRN